MKGETGASANDVNGHGNVGERNRMLLWCEVEEEFVRGLGAERAHWAWNRGTGPNYVGGSSPGAVVPAISHWTHWERERCRRAGICSKFDGRCACVRRDDLD